jgi:hypothetical protein
VTCSEIRNWWVDPAGHSLLYSEMNNLSQRMLNGEVAFIIHNQVEKLVVIQRSLFCSFVDAERWGCI